LCSEPRRQARAALGEEEDALEYLEKAYDERDGSLPLIKVDQRLDALRHDTRFQNLLARLKLAD